MKRETAAFIKAQALDAVAALSGIAALNPPEESSDHDSEMHKKAGILIGKIQTDILDAIYAIHPELDDIPTD